MRFAALLLVLFVWSLPISANDGAMIGIGGTMQPLRGEHKSIRMVREHVRMTLLDRYTYRVVVDFVFRNEGPRTSVVMGFPEGGDGVDVEAEEYKRKSGFDSFATWVDGRRVRALYSPSASRSSEGYKAYWLKRVRFKRGQTRRVRVRYVTPCGWSTVGDGNMNYNFTGGNWRGRVDESLLTATIAAPGTYSMNPEVRYNRAVGNGSMTQNQRANRFFYRWRNWQAEANFGIHFYTLIPNQYAVNFEKPGGNPNQGPEYIIDVPGAPVGRVLYASAHGNNGMMPAAMHHGMAVVALRDIIRWLNEQTTHYDRLQPMQITWNQQKKSAWLRVGPHVFGFRRGKARMVINGKVHRLPGPPLVVKHNWDQFIYVPLAPIMKVLGGKVKAVPERRRLWFHF